MGYGLKVSRYGVMFQHMLCQCHMLRPDPAQSPLMLVETCIPLMLLTLLMRTFCRAPGTLPPSSRVQSYLQGGGEDESLKMQRKPSPYPRSAGYITCNEISLSNNNNYFFLDVKGHVMPGAMKISRQGVCSSDNCSGWRSLQYFSGNARGRPAVRRWLGYLLLRVPCGLLL